VIRGVRFRRARREERVLYLAGLVPEVVVLDLKKSEVADRLTKAVEQGELDPDLLSRLDTALPLHVLEALGYSPAALRRAEAAATEAFRKALGSDR
jgi:hypothetical protein